MAGYVLARLPEARFEQVVDPRKGQTKWKLPALLSAMVLATMAGCKNLREVEELTEALSPELRRKLGFARRQPDTTLRDVLCALPLDGLRSCLHRLVRAAWRRKALEPDGLPFGVMALDGKSTALSCWDEKYIQRKTNPDSGVPYGLARTVTCTLISAAARPCVDAIPIPAKTNEMGHFQQAFDSVHASYGRLFRVVSYDAGALSEENARHVVESGKDYLLALKGEQRAMYQSAQELLEPLEEKASTVDVLDNRTTVTRRLTLLSVAQHRVRGDCEGPAESIWPHAKTVLKVESVMTREEVVIRREARLFVASLEEKALTPKQWLKIVRGHWGVEVNHNILDVAFAEDERPWIVADGNGMLAALVLRRIAYTLLALFRSVSLRSELKGEIAWGKLMRWVWTALVAASEAHLAAIRPRGSAVVWS